MCKETTADRLRKIMSDRNLRQVDILDMAKPYCEKYNVKMNKSDISQYCSGKVEPHQEKLFVLGCALNVSEAWLMGFNVPMERKADDVERFMVTAQIFNSTHKQAMLTESENNMLSRYRELDSHGRKVIDAVLDIEYERCSENKRIAANFNSNDGIELVARNNSLKPEDLEKFIDAINRK